MAAPGAKPNHPYIEEDIAVFRGHISHPDKEDDVKMGYARTGEVATSICVKLYEEHRGWQHSHEINFQRDPNGDINLDALAKLLPVEGVIRVSNPALLGV